MSLKFVLDFKGKTNETYGEILEVVEITELGF